MIGYFVFLRWFLNGFDLLSRRISSPPQTTPDSDGDGLPDDVEIAAAWTQISDKVVVDAVYNYFSQEEGVVKFYNKQSLILTTGIFSLNRLEGQIPQHFLIFKSINGGQTGSWCISASNHQTQLKCMITNFNHGFRWVTRKAISLSLKNE